MYDVLLSMFGFIIIFRLLSLLQKFEVISYKKLIFYFIIFQIPFYIFYFFKDHLIFTLVYIGIFLLGLIFFNKILRLFVGKTFRKHSVRLIDELILVMKTGKSAQASLKEVYSHLNNWEKNVFKPLTSYYEQKDLANFEISHSHQFYFEEVQLILRATSKVIDQLNSFREGLKIQRSLRHKSGQVTQQIRAQAVVALFIYFGVFALSWFQLNLANHFGVICVSICAFLLGEILVFNIGGHIRWKT